MQLHSVFPKKSAKQSASVVLRQPKAPFLLTPRIFPAVSGIQAEVSVLRYAPVLTLREAVADIVVAASDMAAADAVAAAVAAATSFKTLPRAC